MPSAMPVNNVNSITRVLTIRPTHGWISLNLRDLWTYRELLYFLTWRDVKVRYKQTILGVAWAIIQPLMTMVVFTIFFGRLAKIPSDGLPYPLFSFCALLPWTLFSRALSESSNSLVANSNLISKVYFPRLVIPIAAILAGLIDFAIAFIILFGMMAFYGIPPSIAIFALPAFVLFAIMTALAVSMWLSALNVEYRDVRYDPFFNSDLDVCLTDCLFEHPGTRKVAFYLWSQSYGRCHRRLPLGIVGKGSSELGTFDCFSGHCSAFTHYGFGLL